MNQRAGESKPLSAAMWVDGSLFLRLSGAQHAVEHTVRRWGGERLPDDSTLWRDLREMRLPFFQGNAPLWRLSMQSTAPLDAQLGPALVDWCGAQRWVRGAHTLDALQRSAGAGHASLFRGGDRSGEVRAPLERRLNETLHLRLKHAFDPDGILNPGPPVQLAVGDSPCIRRTTSAFCRYHRGRVCSTAADRRLRALRLLLIHLPDLPRQHAMSATARAAAST
jgi:glycolate oxidase FAD binding subunit